jgi:quercetin dioxygenase-like cupin family protein
MSDITDVLNKTADLPDDDPRRSLVKTDPETIAHIGLVGDTYTILLRGEDTGERYCLIDMHVPPGGGPSPHRHDFEETFTVLEGEVEMTFRGEKSVARAGETIHIPANAPHKFHNSSNKAARLLCICAPAGQERFFEQVGIRVPTRTTPPPPMDQETMEKFRRRAEELAPRYRTELLKQA